MSSGNKYDQIDYCLNTLYDYFYNKDREGCYKFKPIIKNNIKLIDIKKLADFDYNDILTGKVKFMGKFNNKYQFKRYSETSYPCTISIGIYKAKNSRYDDMARGELIDM